MKPAIDGFLNFDTNTTLFIHVRMNNLGFIFQSHKWIQHTSTFHRNYNTDKQKWSTRARERQQLVAVIRILLLPRRNLRRQAGGQIIA